MGEGLISTRLVSPKRQVKTLGSTPCPFPITECLRFLVGYTSASSTLPSRWVISYLDLLSNRNAPPLLTTLLAELLKHRYASWRSSAPPRTAALSRPQRFVPMMIGRLNA